MRYQCYVQAVFNETEEFILSIDELTNEVPFFGFMIFVVIIDISSSFSDRYYV